MTTTIPSEGAIQTVRVACAAARSVLHHVPAGEDRPRVAIETVEKWCVGEAAEMDAYRAGMAAIYVEGRGPGKLAANAAAYAAFAAGTPGFAEHCAASAARARGEAP